MSCIAEVAEKSNKKKNNFLNTFETNFIEIYIKKNVTVHITKKSAEGANVVMNQRGHTLKTNIFFLMPFLYEALLVPLIIMTILISSFLECRWASLCLELGP